MFTYLTDSAYILNWGGWVLETPNWVPDVHDKVPLMIGGAMTLSNPRLITDKCYTNVLCLWDGLARLNR